MSLRWQSPVFVKIHENCGGRVRWVEAIDRSGVGYHGECVECGDTELPIEQIIPIMVRGEWDGFGGEFDIREDVLERSKSALAGLEWDDRGNFQTNQKRLRNVFLDDSEADA